MQRVTLCGSTGAENEFKQQYDNPEFERRGFEELHKSKFEIELLAVFDTSKIFEYTFVFERFKKTATCLNIRKCGQN
jgi:hypothetical protein